MKVNIKRIDKTLPLPAYETDGAVCFDLAAREDMIIGPSELVRIKLNLIVETPPGYMLMLVPRSSLPVKKPGLIYPHGVGVIDQDYRGPDDELMLQVKNIGDKPVEIVRGERIAQAGFVKIERAQLKEIEELTTASRGGFGSTG